MDAFQGLEHIGTSNRYGGFRYRHDGTDRFSHPSGFDIVWIDRPFDGLNDGFVDGRSRSCGRLALARFADEMDARMTTAVVLLLAAGSLGVIGLFPVPSMLIGGSIVFGLTVGNVTTLSPIIVRREFGAQAFGLIFGVASCGIQLATALGPGMYGLLHDLFGGYSPAWLARQAWMLRPARSRSQAAASQMRRHDEMSFAMRTRHFVCQAPRTDMNCYSITSSARPSSDSGTARPSAFAACRLMRNSILVDCWTGRFAGFSPLRMRPA